jgi:hypothetical protein
MARRYGKVPLGAAEMNLSKGALRTFVVVSAYANKARWAWASENKIAGHLHSYRRSVCNWLRELEDMGFIRIFRFKWPNRRWAANAYLVTPYPADADELFPAYWHRPEGWEFPSAIFAQLIGVNTALPSAMDALGGREYDAASSANAPTQTKGSEQNIEQIMSSVLITRPPAAAREEVFEENKGNGQVKVNGGMVHRLLSSVSKTERAEDWEREKSIARKRAADLSNDPVLGKIAARQLKQLEDEEEGPQP